MTTVHFHQLVLDTLQFRRPAGALFTNPRRTTGKDVRELAVNIGLLGLLNPLLVRDVGIPDMPRYVVIAGSRRYRAIAFLVEWFTHEAQGRRAHALDLGELGPAVTSLSFREIDYIERMTERLYAAVPVQVLDAAMTDLTVEGVALADNVQREDLSSYEIAARLFELHHAGASGVQLARLIGKSTTYVSRKLSAFRGAGPELKQIWEAGEISEERVQALAEQPRERQVIALDGVPVRGPAHRPGIDAVKDVLTCVSAGDLTEHLTIAQRCEISGAGVTYTEAVYRKAVIDTLRWVAGQKSSADFARIVEPSVRSDDDAASTTSKETRT